MKNATFTGKVKAVADESHPLQHKLQFVFTDFQPNVNRQAIPVEESDNIIQSAINQPVKINFRGKAKGHLGAIPIGPIVSAYREGDRILAEAVMWKSEFKDVAEYLTKASAEEGGVNFSWELYYSDSEEKDGISWLHDVTVAATTIVDVPAYQGRTPLLAIAEGKQMEELQKQMADLTAELKSLREAQATLEGTIAEKDKTIAELQSALAEANATAETLKSLETEVEELRTFKADAEKAKAEAEAIAARKTKLAEAGIEMGDEAFNARKDTFLAMSDEVFEAYVKDMAAMAAKTKTAQASGNEKVVFPDPISGRDNEQLSMKDLAKAFRELRG